MSIFQLFFKFAFESLAKYYITLSVTSYSYCEKDLWILKIKLSKIIYKGIIVKAQMAKPGTLFEYETA